MSSEAVPPEPPLDAARAAGRARAAFERERFKVSHRRVADPETYWVLKRLKCCREMQQSPFVRRQRAVRELRRKGVRAVLLLG